MTEVLANATLAVVLRGKNVSSQHTIDIAHLRLEQCYTLITHCNKNERGDHSW